MPWWLLYLVLVHDTGMPCQGHGGRLIFSEVYVSSGFVIGGVAASEGSCDEDRRKVGDMVP